MDDLLGSESEISPVGSCLDAQSPACAAILKGLETVRSKAQLRAGLQQLQPPWVPAYLSILLGLVWQVETLPYILATMS